MKKKELGQFFTKNSEYIVGNLIDIYPENSDIVDPFCGEGDLLKLVKDGHKISGYDIDKKIKGSIQQDTLLNPIDYTGKWIITNPPYLSRNKNNDKTLYDMYDLGDLYKISLKTLIGCQGGVIIIPLNFFSGDDFRLRNEFLSRYNIVKMNIFEERVFDDTDYTVCSFSFIKKEQTSQILKCLVYPSLNNVEFDIDLETNFVIGSEFYKLLNIKQKIDIKRLVDYKDIKPNSKLYLRAIDTGSNDGRISLSLKDEHFYAKHSDRSFATIVLDKEYSIEIQQLICEKFNEIIELYRKKYNSLFLTNFRNSSKTYARKRISFDTAYDLINYIIYTCC